MTTLPRMIDDPAFKALRVDDKEGFKRERASRKSIDLTDANLRSVDFRNLDLTGVVLAGAYLRDADLRGQDLSGHDLRGCSLRGARIGGVLFPANVSAEEIRLSVEHGTRLRADG